LASCSRRVRVRMLGVWDTVGALGIPFRYTPVFNPRRYRFHDTNPSVLYDDCFHAIAIDEHRAPYRPTLWTRYVPTDASWNRLRPKDESPKPPRVEQRWFSGVHSQIGGGYRDDRVKLVSLEWMQRRAYECGLAFDRRVVLDGTEHLAKLRSSRRGLWDLIRPLDRVIGGSPRRLHDARNPDVYALSEPMNEIIDASVFERWRADPDYRPASIVQWAQHVLLEREGLDVAALQGDQPAVRVSA